MQFDQRMLSRLLAMNDTQLAAVIEKIAAESGIDPTLLGLDTNNIEQIRRALGSATPEDLAQLGNVYESYRQNRKK